MGTAKSRMKRVAPASVTEESGRSSVSHRDDGSQFSPSSAHTSARRGCNSDGQDSEFSAEDLAEEVDRILEEFDRSPYRTSFKMSVFPSEETGMMHYAKNQDFITVVKPGSNMHDKLSGKVLVNCDNTKNTATASGYGIDGGSSQALPVIYDASEEDLMNTIEKEFG